MLIDGVLKWCTCTIPEMGRGEIGGFRYEHHRKRLRNRLRGGKTVISLARKQVKNYLKSNKEMRFLLQECC